MLPSSILMDGKPDWNHIPFQVAFKLHVPENKIIAIIYHELFLYMRERDKKEKKNGISFSSRRRGAAAAAGRRDRWAVSSATKQPPPDR